MESKEDKDWEDIYNEFDYKCRSSGLTEIYSPTNKIQYERFLLMLQNNNIPGMGYKDDYECKYEIRFRQ